MTTIEEEFSSWVTSTIGGERTIGSAFVAGWEAARRKYQVTPVVTSGETGPVPRDHIMQFFNCDHLPADLQKISRPFHDMALWIEANLPRNPERTVALRKLLEAKDAAVRTVVAKE